MQEKAKKKRSGLTARLEKRDATVWIARLSKLGVELLWGGVAFLLGQGEMLFGTMPLGLALLCAGQGHVLAVLIGLILSATVYSEIAVVYIVTYCIAAVIRVISRMLLDTPDERERMEYELGERLSAAEILYASVCKEENQEAKQGRFGFGQAVGNIRSMLGVLFSERIRLRMATAAICSLIVSLYRVIRGGFTYYDWNASTMDSEGKFTPYELYKNAVNTSLNKNKIILLAHDTKPNVTLALEDIIKHFLNCGYTFKKL